MNKVYYLLFLLVFTSAELTAQKKTLTLSDAVMQQYRAFAPEKLSGFSWIPNTTEYTFFEKYTTLKKASVINSTPEVLMSIEELNKILNAKLSWFSGFKWKDQNVFLVNDGSSYYSYDFSKKEGRKILTSPEKAENHTYYEKSELLAYTIENNLFIAASDGKQTPVTNQTNKEIVSGQTYARSEFGINNGIFWSPNGNFLAFAQKDETSVHNYPLLNINEVPGKLENTKYPITGQKSEKPRIGIYNLKTKYTAFIQPISAPDSYLTNVVWTPDEKFILIAEVNRAQNQMWLNLYNAESGNFVRTLFEEKNDKWVEPEHAAFFPSDASNNFVWISERDGFNNLYYYDLNGKLIKKLTSNTFVIKDILKSINKGNEIVFSATGQNPTNTLYYSVDLKGKQKCLTPNEGSHHIVFSDDEKWIMDEYSSHDIPSKSVLVETNGKSSKVLMEGINKLLDYQIGSAEVFTIKNEEGTNLYARLIKPSNFDPNKKYPVLIYVYGGPHAQMITNSWMDGASLWMYWLAEQGYLVFTVDNRGSAERGFEFESGIHRRLGTLEVQDQMTGVKYLQSLPYVDGSRIAVHGWSFGGFMTCSMLLKNPSVFKVGVAGGAVTDWKFYEVMYGERYMDTPEENPEGYKESSLFTHASQLQSKLLMIHGTVDDVVVMQHAYSLIKKFIELGKHPDFFPYPMHKHNVSGKDRVHLMETVLNYVIENNK
ncbi:MAG: DPP IV N-terminal domain-containing protein [Flavobacteriia bacterium]|nr:DPP IV N-terminal domain-containing protein [Flavobacteriia bacterium]